MYPIEDGREKKLRYYCRTCRAGGVGGETTGYDEEADDYCIARFVIKHSEKEKTLVLGDMLNDPTLARSKDVSCQKCDAREAVYKQVPTIKGMDLYFQCVKCGNEWSEIGH